MGLPELPQKQVTSRGDQMGYDTTATNGKLYTEKNKAAGNSMLVANPKQLRTYNKSQAEPNGKTAPDFCRTEPRREGCSSLGWW